MQPLAEDWFLVYEESAAVGQVYWGISASATVGEVHVSAWQVLQFQAWCHHWSVVGEY